MADFPFDKNTKWFIAWHATYSPAVKVLIRQLFDSLHAYWLQWQVKPSWDVFDVPVVIRGEIATIVSSYFAQIEDAELENRLAVLATLFPAGHSRLPALKTRMPLQFVKAMTVISIMPQTVIKPPNHEAVAHCLTQDNPKKRLVSALQAEVKVQTAIESPKIVPTGFQVVPRIDTQNDAPSKTLEYFQTIPVIAGSAEPEIPVQDPTQESVKRPPKRQRRKQ